MGVASWRSSSCSGEHVVPASLSPCGGFAAFPSRFSCLSAQARFVFVDFLNACSSFASSRQTEIQARGVSDVDQPVCVKDR